MVVCVAVVRVVVATAVVAGVVRGSVVGRVGVRMTGYRSASWKFSDVISVAVLNG